MNYWDRAALLREIAIQEGAGYTAAQMLRLYDEALEDIETEVQKIQANFQRRYGINNKTASYFLTAAQEEENLKTLVKLLDEAPNTKAREDILEYIHRDGLSVRAYAARTERYKALEKAIYTRIKRLVIPSVNLLGERLQKTYRESYYGAMDDTARGLNVGINFSIINDRAVKEATEAKWHGSRFSERIWRNTDRLAERAQDLIVKSIISGESWTKTTAKLAAEFEVEKFHAATLVHTEAAHIHAQADLKAYADLGIEEYKYLATLDDRTCERCQSLDGMVFRVSDARAGENFPTLHPRCRCTTTMNTDYKSRRARNPLTGKSELIDGSITYAEWKESLSPEQKAALELSQKKNSRRTSDKLQHKQYMDVLGTKNVPRAFDKFQDLKYNDKEKWQFIKLDYKRRNALIEDPELALPNAKSATADDRKFTAYLFGGNHKEGLAKGRAFTSRLGYDINNYKDLKAEILKNADKYPTKSKNSDIHGDCYEQKMILYGVKDKPANVKIGWKTKDRKTWLTSAYIKEVDRK